MTNEERLLVAVRHLEEGLAHLDHLANEVDSSNKDVQKTVSEAREELSCQIDQLSELGGDFARSQE